MKKAERPKPDGKRSDASTQAATSATVTSAHSTVGGPAIDDAPARVADAATDKMRGVQALAAGMPFNENKPAEYDDAFLAPPRFAADW